VGRDLTLFIILTNIVNTCTQYYSYCIHKIYYVALIVQHGQRNPQRRHVWNESLKMFHDLC